MRPQDEAWRARLDALVRAGDLRGRRVLDIGCGTGALAAALAEEHAARVWCVDPSEQMLAVARARLPRGAGARAGRAERLPFRDAWFERAVMSLVVHLVDRPVAFAEARRVLRPGGRLAIATFGPGHFGRTWLDPYFPSLERVDRARFPELPALEAELAAAGLRPLPPVEIVTAVRLTREQALARLRGRHISTFDLLDPAEVEDGVRRAEAELPDPVESRLEHVVVVATVP